MEEQILKESDLPDQLSDILLVLDKAKKKIQAVTGIDKNGDLKTVDAEKKNQSQFMRVDKHGDFLSNFFSNFFKQLKDPTRFKFFKVPMPLALDMADKMQKHVDNPSVQGEQLMKEQEVVHEQHKDSQQENNKNMETTQTPTEASEYRYSADQIDWETMSNLGLSKERLEKMNLLEPLLKGYKTNELVPISLNLGTAITRMDGRLSLQKNDDGNVVVAIHGIRREPGLHFPFFGHDFSKEDKENLQNTGNMGRVVELTNPKTGETIPSIVSVDRLTNELVALRVDKIKIPEEIKGVKLSEDQKSALQEGKPLYIEGMISRKGEPFNAEVQYNADKRFVEFLFNNNVSNNVQQGQSTGASKVFRGKKLDDNQYQRLKDGQTVFLTGIIDKKGQEYKGYITYNKETKKTAFSFQNPDKMREKVQPAAAHATQVAVNSDGITNEATTAVKEPLKSGQSALDNKKQPQKQQKATQVPAQKAKGRKL